MRQRGEAAKPKLKGKTFSGALTKPADKLSQQIAEYARNAGDAESCEAMLADTREQLVQQMLAKHQTPGAAERIVDEIIGSPHVLLAEHLLRLQQGQVRAGYSAVEHPTSPTTV